MKAARPMLHFWQGRPLESLTHAELVEAVKLIGGTHNTLLEDMRVTSLLRAEAAKWEGGA